MKPANFPARKLARNIRAKNDMKDMANISARLDFARTLRSKKSHPFNPLRAAHRRGKLAV